MEIYDRCGEKAEQEQPEGLYLGCGRYSCQKRGSVSVGMIVMVVVGKISDR
jgi:hypothetical protein